MTNPIRPLRANEIEVRVGTVNEKGVTLLLYKDARVDQQILDETFGALNWRRYHECINGSVYCTVEVFDSEKKEWVGKQDVGTSGQMEKEKSSASDSFKRACVNWGVGRELYSSPLIWIPAAKAEIVMRGEKYVCYERFAVHSIDFSEKKEIANLVIVNSKGEVVYRFHTRAEETPPAITDKQKNALNAELVRTGVAKETVYGRYNISSDKDLTTELYDRMMKALSRTKSAGSAA